MEVSDKSSESLSLLEKAALPNADEASLSETVTRTTWFACHAHLCIACEAHGIVDFVKSRGHSRDVFADVHLLQGKAIMVGD